MMAQKCERSVIILLGFVILSATKDLKYQQDDTKKLIKKKNVSSNIG